MGDVRMALQDADLERIGRYVQSQLPGWLDAADRPLPGVQIVERLTRLEDAILSGQELMRSEFRAQRDLMDRRFDAVDQRFESMQKQMDERFTAVLREIEVRSAVSDKRFEAVDKRFEAVDKRFDDMQANFGRMQWLIGVGFLVLGSLVSIFHFLG